MGIFINKGTLRFREILKSRFVDKSGVIDFLNKSIGTDRRFVCVSRPRRFGKSVIANMLQCYYDRSEDSKPIFDKLEISNCPSYLEHINKYPVITVDMSFFLTYDKDEIVDRIQTDLIKDLKRVYTFLEEDTNLALALAEINMKTGDRFVFMVDEWDCLIRDVDKDVQDKYLNMLRALFKSNNAREIFALVYMTGILPIIKYETQSALNNFKEYSVIDPFWSARYYGFTSDEVRMLCAEFDMDFERTKQAYDSYIIGSEREMFNPSSVMENAERKTYASFWGRTASFSLVNRFIQIDADNVRQKLLLMLNGESVGVEVVNFRNDIRNIDDADDVFTLLIHLGYLSYDPEACKAKIPNTELMEEFKNILRDANWGELSLAVKKSRDLLDETIKLNKPYIEDAFDRYHFEAASILRFNDENSMACAIRLAYYSAISYYRIIREFPTGKGFADIVLIPLSKSSGRPAVVVELKFDKSASGAIKQISDKNYPESLKGFSDKIILLGINYNKRTSKHDVMLQIVNG